MADCIHLVIVIFMIINSTTCFSNHHILKRVEEINNKSREMYGSVRKDDFYNLNSHMYPRGDKRKLSELSEAWREYYTCSGNLIGTMTDVRLLPNVILMVFQGSVARLPCKLCADPDNLGKLKWMFAKSPSGHFGKLESYDRLTVEHGTMTIYNVMPQDEGVFWCRLGASGGGIVIMEVTDTEPYTVVKPPTSRGPHAVPTEMYQGIILFSQWSPWSECSVCGKVGRRHRYGVCYVNIDQNLVINYEIDPVQTAGRNKLIELDDKIIELFQAFPGGLPCRSQYLPKTLRDLEALQQRPSEIMIGMCKVPCTKTPITKNKDVNLTHYNLEESGTLYYSLKDMLPRQPPVPVRNTIFAAFQQRIALRCPGTTLRDVPILWQVGTKSLNPRDVDRSSGGRVHINSRDHLVFTTVYYRDENLYSCWQRGNLAGSVQLVVWAGPHARWNQPAALCCGLALALLLLRLTKRAARSLQRPQPALYHLH